MHFLRVLERWSLVYLQDRDERYEPSFLQYRDDKLGTLFMPRPVVEEFSNATRSWTSIPFGEQKYNLSSCWLMNHVHLTNSVGDLSSMAVSGSVGEAINLMLPSKFYNRG
jgi:hypothetical protein